MEEEVLEEVDDEAQEGSVDDECVEDEDKDKDEDEFSVLFNSILEEEEEHRKTQVERMPRMLSKTFYQF
eukprot:4106372-Ditylum_brightwellii.AAC.1